MLAEQLPKRMYDDADNIVLNKELKTLIDFINGFYFDYDKKYNFQKTGYFTYLFKYYYQKPYFYLKYLLHLVKLLSKFCINTEKDNKYKRINVFNIIKINISLKYKMRKEWRKKNADNNISLRNFEQIDKVVVGRGSYGTIDAEFASLGDEKLIIGNYCSIANGVKFIVASDHFYKGLSTYPFKVFNFKEKAEAISKGDIVLKDDVWIGANAIILSGVTIGQGAIVGAGAVVTKDVPDNVVVYGNPAKIMRTNESGRVFRQDT